MGKIRGVKKLWSLEGNYGAYLGSWLYSPALVMAIVEQTYDKKEDRRIGVRGWSPLENVFDHTFSTSGKRPFGYKDASLSK